MSATPATGSKIELPRIFSAIRRIHLRVPAQQRQNIYDSVKAGSGADMEYGALVALAALIALLGLLQNSAAVIIGAMLISPMMNPLLAGALALLLGDGNLGRRSAIVLGSSVAASIALTWFVAFLIPLNQATPEILARTTPNLLDLFIAFLSGLAGTLALRGGSSSMMILPGVAIAVAVVPPLAVVGYGLSTSQFSVSAGAFLLFLTNLVAIVISAALVFRSMGFRPQQAAEAGRWRLKYRMAISAGVLLVLSIPLFLTLRRAVSQIRLRSEVSGRLDAELRGNHASISDMSLAFAGNRLQIHATVRAVKYLDPSQIAAIENSLQDRFGSGTRLQVDQILVAVGGVSPPPPARSQNAISGGVVRPAAQPPAFDFKNSENALVQHLQTQMDELLAGASIRRTAPLQVQLGSGSSAVVAAELSAPGPIAPQTVELLSSQLSSRLTVPIQLRGTVELSGASYGLAFDTPPAARVIPAGSRGALDKIVRVFRSTPSSLLQVSYRLPPGVPQDTAPPLLRQFKAAFTRAGLKSSQWTIQQASPPPAPAAAPAAAPAPAGPAPSARAPKPTQAQPVKQVHYDFRIIQNF
jgi:uncharacterized hydrophobic protein (TIGR00271 family)